jgi:hypothetical protein
MLFNFQLRPINDVAPWQRDGEDFLNWFGLTDGWYWLKCGEEELFRYSGSVLASWKYEGRQQEYPPYVDYQVVRLWEDVLEMLPDVLTPIPEELLRKIEPGIDACKWRGDIAELVFPDGHEVSQPMEEHFDLATIWLQSRKLDVLHLKGGPRIWFWTDGTTMFIHWDNSDLTLDGHSEWASTKGTYCIPLEAFIEEVRSFDSRLIDAMKERVEAIRCSWDRPSIQIDKQALLVEQQQRACALSEAFQRVKDHYPTPWNTVAKAIKYFEDLGCVIPKMSHRA